MKKLMTVLVAVLAIGAGAGCAVTVSAHGTMFKKEAAEAEKTAGLARSTAKVLLAAGRSAAEVEQIVRSTGVDSDAARRIVAEVQAEIGAK